MKLYGHLGQHRPATDAELQRLKCRMRRTRGLRGHRYLWENMGHVREVHIERVKTIWFGEMGPV